VALAFVLVNEVLQEERNVAHLQIAALAQFSGDIDRNILRPALGGIEGNDASGVFAQPGEQVSDNCF
jgi:hypothetical protein